MFLAFLGSSFVVATINYVILTQFLRKYLTKKNFRGRKIPSGSGFVLLVTYILIMIFYVFLQEDEIIRLREWVLPLTILVIAMGALGLIDDMFGQRGVGGFRGHFGELLKGRVTTGVIKAIGGGLTCLYVAQFFSKNLVALAVNGLLMALFANIFNLLDLRPGRALKLFLILELIVFMFSFKSGFWALAGIFMGVAIVLLWADLSESCMLGDVGSNILGAVIGLSFVANFSWIINACVLVLLALAQVYAESHSFSELIENNPVLCKLDELGRRKERRGTSRRHQNTV